MHRAQQIEKCTPSRRSAVADNRRVASTSDFVLIRWTASPFSSHSIKLIGIDKTCKEIDGNNITVRVEKEETKHDKGSRQPTIIENAREFLEEERKHCQVERYERKYIMKKEI